MASYIKPNILLDPSYIINIKIKIYKHYYLKIIYNCLIITELNYWWLNEK